MGAFTKTFGEYSMGSLSNIWKLLFDSNGVQLIDSNGVILKYKKS